jgi:hypothetical protein
MVYAFISMLTWVGSIAAFIIGLTNHEAEKRYLWIIGLATFIFSPVVYETLLNFKGFVRRSSLNEHNCRHLHEYYPIVYHPSYNITAGGLERCHPFDSQKYGRIFGFL